MNLGSSVLMDVILAYNLGNGLIGSAVLMANYKSMLCSQQHEFKVKQQCIHEVVRTVRFVDIALVGWNIIFTC